MLKAKTTKILMRETALFLLNKPALNVEKAKYSAKIGLIMYTIVKTRIDIAFATSMVSWFAKNLSSEHFNAIDQILHYLAESRERSIIFEAEKELKLVRYLDSD